MAVGFLVMLASGLCSLAFGLSFATGSPIGFIGMILVFGGAPFVFGLLIFGIGKRVYGPEGQDTLRG